MIKKPTLKHRIVAVFFTLLLIVYVGNTTFFIHEHNVGDLKIVHSHPYSSASHSHTANTFAAISLLSAITALSDIFIGEIEVDERLLAVLEQETEQFFYFESIYNLSLRAPPIL